jgi:uncharacterized protein (DUF488 family)
MAGVPPPFDVRSGRPEPGRGALLYSIGHSTRAEDDFVALLHAYTIAALADVRTIPASRRHPQFGSDRLRDRLARDAIEYRHMPELGGLRRPRPDSANTAWTNDAFRGYADYMETKEFKSGVESLLELAAARVVAFMCAEAVWWRCHRRLLSDALLARGAEVRHILTPSEAPPHQLPPFARIVEGRVAYTSLF